LIHLDGLRFAIVQTQQLGPGRETPVNCGF
jgi:hypothetical protein